MKRKQDLQALLLALRPTQWLKNFILYAAITFNGELFDPGLFMRVLHGVIAFSFLSSASYLINDIKDLPLDSKHPVKKLRPIASGSVSHTVAIITAIVTMLVGSLIAYKLSTPFLIVSLLFFFLHVAYTFWFKQFPTFDILIIALSFTLRGFAGEVLTGLHIPIWLILTIVFLSLFIASAKRHSELIQRGTGTRISLLAYRERLLDFYTTTFATATLITYALFVFFEDPPAFNLYTQEFLSFILPFALERKWLVLTFPFVLIGVMRYAKIVYEHQGGEAPEKLVTQDMPLLLTVLGWGIAVITIIYLV